MPFASLSRRSSLPRSSEQRSVPGGPGAGRDTAWRRVLRHNPTLAGDAGRLAVWRTAWMGAWADDWTHPTAHGARRALLCAEYPWIADLLETAPLVRLDGVGFLGGIDHCFDPVGHSVPDPLPRRHSRLTHSVDVAFLTFVYGCLIGSEDHVIQAGIAAALLHDIGHTPLSHSLEPAFIRAIGLDHHQLGAVHLQAPAKSGSVVGVLQAAGLDPEAVLVLLSRGGDPLWLHGVINCDGLDGAARTVSYVDPPGYHPPPIATLCALVTGSSADAEAAGDMFWQLKGRAYSQVIYGPSGRFADTRCADYVSDVLGAGALTRSDAAQTDVEFLRNHPELIRILAGGPVPWAGEARKEPFPDLFVIDRAQGWSRTEGHQCDGRYLDRRGLYGLGRSKGPSEHAQ